jgi:hypothetical protein
MYFIPRNHVFPPYHFLKLRHDKPFLITACTLLSSEKVIEYNLDKVMLSGTKSFVSLGTPIYQHI